MTNAMIILMESVKLMEKGVLAPTGQKITVEDAEGNKRELDVPEQLHTYQKWKALGYQVKKGSKAVAQFSVWKYIKGKAKGETEEEAQANGHCYLHNASFFKLDQCEKMETA